MKVLTCPSARLDLAQAEQLFGLWQAAARNDDVTLDLSGVTSADSSALALILETLRAADSAGHRVSVAHLPASLHGLAALYGLGPWLGRLEGNTAA